MATAFGRVVHEGLYVPLECPSELSGSRLPHRGRAAVAEGACRRHAKAGGERERTDGQTSRNMHAVTFPLSIDQRRFRPRLTKKRDSSRTSANQAAPKAERSQLPVLSTRRDTVGRI